MKSRAVMTIVLASAFAFPMQAAHAGPIKDSLKVVAFGAKLNGAFLKSGLKTGAKLAKANVQIGACALKVALKKPC